MFLNNVAYRRNVLNRLKLLFEFYPEVQKPEFPVPSSLRIPEKIHSEIDDNKKKRHSKGLLKKADEGKFGFFFDIDGVFLRGKTILPEARSAFELMLNRHQRWKVPAVFVTNAGGMLKRDKAEQLSELFGVKVHANQVVMCHSPLRQFKEYHNKQILAVGQGPVKMIAHNLGFSKVTTIEEFIQQYPRLNVVDMKRKKAPICAFEEYNPAIEAVVLFNEPLNWETSLQLLLDILFTNGQPYKHKQTDDIPYPHIPILACNMDLLWMAEAPLPRLGHGAFLLCMESLYEKVAGKPIRYNALVGKPSEVTYRHAERVLNAHASHIGISPPLKRIYCVGDNPETDIMGANLYNRYLTFVQRSEASERRHFATGSEGTSAPGLAGLADFCHSILVCTGVYHPDEPTYSGGFTTDHNHRDFADYPQLKEPTHTVSNVHQAVQYVLEKERAIE